MDRRAFLGLIAAGAALGAARPPKRPRPAPTPTPTATATPTPTPTPTPTVSPTPSASPQGWAEVGTADDTTIGDTYIAPGDDTDLTAALGAVPAEISRAAVLIAGT